MKKLIFIILALSFICLFVLSSCDSTDNNPPIDSNQQAVEGTSDDSDATDAPIDCQHTFGEWNTVKEATCKEEGKRVRSCSICAEAEEEVISKSETHAIVADIAVSATCKDTGLTEGSHCSVCNKVLVAQTVIPKTEDHTLVIDAAVAASCNNTGLTEGSHCSVCRKVIVEQATIPKLKHVYDQKKITSEYVRTKATTSASATYYYSCICGSKGSTYFSYGSPISDNSGWSSCNKTVYGIAQTYFYTKPNATAVCGMCKVGYSFKVVSTNGEWYKVSGSNVYTNCEAYIKCSDVTDNSSMATFVKVPEEYEYAVDASIKNQFKGAYLCNDISGRSTSKVGLIQGSGYITVASVNQSKTWAAVYYFGNDSEGRSYDGSKLYYCSFDDIAVYGLPDNWP